NHASVELFVAGSRLRVVVKDDGVGFDLEEKLAEAVENQKLGLQGMQERTAMMKGTLSIRSKKGHGTTVSLAVPYQSQPQEMDREFDESE
ncbi:hypothetical protein GF324_12455, partial [bacterium]|nr:hypothetical protein [bacterium]